MNCPSIRYIVPVKISFALSLCQKNWFCGKVCLDDFYLLLCSKSSSWVHIGVKKNSQAYCLHHLKKYGKNIKHNFGMRNKTGCFFGPPCIKENRVYRTLWRNNKMVQIFLRTRKPPMHSSSRIHFWATPFFLIHKWYASSCWLWTIAICWWNVLNISTSNSCYK